MIDSGADENAIVYFNRSPMHLAAKGGNLKVFKKANSFGLIRLKFLGEAKIVKLLLEKGVQVDARDGFDFAPLHIAAYEGLKKKKIFFRCLTDYCMSLKCFQSFQCVIVENVVFIRDKSIDIPFIDLEIGLFKRNTLFFHSKMIRCSH